jgi:NDP-sugar pyrophosphorylase family protein
VRMEGLPALRVHGVVLAGAHDWKSSSVQQLGPRALWPIAQTPLICYALRWLASGEVNDATICANSAARSIRDSLGAGAALSMSLTYSEDWTPRGPAGCVRDAGLPTSADVFVVVDGATVPTADLKKIVEAHTERGAALTVVANEVDLPLEAPLSPTGIYVFSRRTLELVPPRGFQDLKEALIPRLNSLGEAVMVHAIPGACPRVMNAPTYLAVNEWLVERFAREGDGLVGYASVGEALVHSTAEIADDACLVGPVLVGPSVQVRSRATVVGPTSVGNSSRIEAGACVSRSAVWSGCVVGEGAFVDQSILADHAIVPRGRADRNALRHGPARVPALRRPSLRSDDLALSGWRGTSQTSPRPEDRRAVLVQPGPASRGSIAETRRP